jgi:hypothetical protein
MYYTYLSCSRAHFAGLSTTHRIAKKKQKTWQTSVDLREKLYLGRETLKRTANFLKMSGVPD